MDKKLIYFGTDGTPGHYFFGECGPYHSAYKSYFPGINPNLLASIDGAFTPGFTREQGKYMVTITHPVMIVAWHDYTGDKRPGSHCTLIGMGFDTPEEMINEAYKKYPSFMSRQPRPVPAIPPTLNTPSNR